MLWKIFLISLTLVTSISAKAMEKTIDLGEITLKSEDITVEPEFAYSKKLGRAWVNLAVKSMQERDGGPVEFFQEHKVHVDGLWYDTSTRSVVFENGNGENTVCARVSWMADIKTTGACSFLVNVRKELYDDGFDDVHQYRIARVSLLIGD